MLSRLNRHVSNSTQGGVRGREIYSNFPPTRGGEKLKDREFKDKYRSQVKEHYNLFIIVIVLVILGILMQYSASKSSITVLKKSLSFGIISLMLFAVIQQINIKNITILLGKYFYFMSFIPIFLLLTPLAVESHGAKRWVQVFGIQFQVAELVKLSVILFEAYIINQLSRYKLNKRGEYIKILLLWTVGIIPALLLFILSKDLSSSFVILIITFIITFVATNKTWLHLVTAGSAITIVSLYIRNITLNLPSQKELNHLPFRIGRIAAWINPEKYESDQGYQVLQSLYAVGSGGFFGKGLGKSIIKTRMPEAHTDMIFSIICEELGAFGGILIIVAIAYIVYLIVLISVNAETLLESIISLGVAVHITFQSIVNIGVCLNLIPNTGIGLVFISYGGTALITQMMEIGIVVSISKRHYICKVKRQINEKE